MERKSGFIKMATLFFPSRSCQGPLLYLPWCLFEDKDFDETHGFTYATEHSVFLQSGRNPVVEKETSNIIQP